MKSKTFFSSLCIIIAASAFFAICAWFAGPRYFPQVTYDYSPFFYQRFMVARDYLADTGAYDVLLEEHFSKCEQWLADSIMHENEEVRYATCEYIISNFYDTDACMDALFASCKAYHDHESLFALFVFKHKTCSRLGLFLEAMSPFERAQFEGAGFPGLYLIDEYDWTKQAIDAYSVCSVDDVRLFTKCLAYPEFEYDASFALYEWLPVDLGEGSFVERWLEVLESGEEFSSELFLLIVQANAEMASEYMMRHLDDKAIWEQCMSELKDVDSSDSVLFKAASHMASLLCDRLFLDQKDLTICAKYIGDLLSTDCLGYQVLGATRFDLLYMHADESSRKDLRYSIEHDLNLDVYLKLAKKYSEFSKNVVSARAFTSEDDRQYIWAIFSDQPLDSFEFKIARKMLNTGFGIEYTSEQRLVACDRYEESIKMGIPVSFRHMLNFSTTNNDVITARLTSLMQDYFDQGDYRRSSLVATTLTGIYRAQDK